MREAVRPFCSHALTSMEQFTLAEQKTKCSGIADDASGIMGVTSALFFDVESTHLLFFCLMMPHDLAMLRNDQVGNASWTHYLFYNIWHAQMPSQIDRPYRLKTVEGTASLEVSTYHLCCDLPSLRNQSEFAAPRNLQLAVSEPTAGQCEVKMCSWPDSLVL